MRHVRIDSILFAGGRDGNESFILIEVSFQNIRRRQCRCPAANKYSGCRLVLTFNRIEKLTKTSAPLIPRYKGGIGQKKDFDLAGSPILYVFRLFFGCIHLLLASLAGLSPFRAACWYNQRIFSHVHHAWIIWAQRSFCECHGTADSRFWQRSRTDRKGIPSARSYRSATNEPRMPGRPYCDRAPSPCPAVLTPSEPFRPAFRHPSGLHDHSHYHTDRLP
jgi:hypothetical protein